MRVHTLPLLFLASALFVAGCGKRESSTSHITTIAVIPKGTTHEFWKSIHAGAVKASRELQVEIIWKGPLREDDREAQISVMEDFVSRGVTGIVLAPLDDIALRGPVANAASSGIPVVIIDSDLKSDDYVSFAATDNQGAAAWRRRQVGRQDMCGIGCCDGSVKRAQQQLACAFCLHINFRG